MGRPARGFTLVELLAALAIGLVIVACGALLLQTARHEARRTVGESRVLQDLRHAAEQIARNLRRAGHWAAAGDAVGRGSAANPYAALDASAGTLAWSWSRDAAENGSVDANERFGLRLAAGAVQFQVGGAWQTMTDSGTVVVTALDLVPQQVETPLPALCDAPCAAGSTQCPPRHLARSVAVSLVGHAPGAPAVQRRFDTTVRLRNDLVVGSCE